MDKVRGVYILEFWELNVIDVDDDTYNGLRFTIIIRKYLFGSLSISLLNILYLLYRREYTEFKFYFH